MISSVDGTRMELQWDQPNLIRPVKGSELSDGTLQFIALTAALLSPKSPSLLVLNESENSLNPGLFPALVELIKHANQSAQILVITHSVELAQTLVEDLDATSLFKTEPPAFRKTLVPGELGISESDERISPTSQE